MSEELERSDEDRGVVLCDLPDEVREALAERDRLKQAVNAAHGGYEFVVSDLDAWGANAQLKVAFLGGSNELLSSIEEVLAEIEAVCSASFVLRDEEGEFLRWTENDTQYAGQIRVSFDKGGYWSLVGQDSVDPHIASAAGYGGRPGLRSLNLSGFDSWLPAGWRGTVLHEFMHALGFHHEHQNQTGPCQEDFRWEDDEGYVPTTNTKGVFIADPAGKRPGIYTYLSGPPNGWSKAKIDHNLRADPTANLRYGDFDIESVMLYRFDSLFYVRPDSPCRAASAAQSLSARDIEGLTSLYPRDDAAAAALVARKESLIEKLEGLGPADVGLEAVESSARLESSDRWVSRVRTSIR